jgi:hypothetical protein
LATAVRRDWQSASIRIAWAKVQRQSLPIQIAIFTPILTFIAMIALPEVRGWSQIVANDPKKWIEGLGIFGLPILGYLFSKLSQPMLEGLRSMMGSAKADAIGALERFAFDFDILAAAQPRGTRFVVLVEDLDRCSPSHVIDVLSAIALLDGHPKADRIAFLLAYEREKLLRSIEASVGKDATDGKKDELARNYLEKIVQLELPLPDVSPTASVANQFRAPRIPMILRGSLISLAIVAFAVAHLTEPWVNCVAAWTVFVIVVVFCVEYAVRCWMKTPEEKFDAENWEQAAVNAQPWLSPLPLRMRARVLSRARAALMMRPSDGLSAWDAVSIATLASRWPNRFSRSSLAEMVGNRAVDIDHDFREQAVTDAIKEMAAASLETSQFTDAAKLYAIVSTFKR